MSKNTSVDFSKVKTNPDVVWQPSLGKGQIEVPYIRGSERRNPTSSGYKLHLIVGLRKNHRRTGSTLFDAQQRMIDYRRHGNANAAIESLDMIITEEDAPNKVLRNISNLSVLK